MAAFWVSPGDLNSAIDEVGGVSVSSSFGGSLFASFSTGILLVFVALGQAGGSGQDSEAKAFVHKRWIEGIPESQASKYSSDSETKALIDILNDPREKADWANASLTLGMAGNAHAESAIEEFITSGQGKLSPEDYNAKTTAILALGIFAKKTGSEDALHFLERMSTSPEWIRAKVKWRGPSGDSATGIESQLSRAASAALKIRRQDDH
jgi:hypothetical protein